MDYLKSILIVMNLLTFYNQASSQINYSDGYLIKKSTEKVQGLIKLESETKLSYAVQYKKDKKSSIETFTANDIKGFSTVEGWYFESFEVFVDKRPKQLFLRKVIDGYVDLYTLKLGVNTRYFILTKDNVLEEIKESLSQENMKVIKKYQGIKKLRILFSDCETVINEIDEDFVVSRKTLIDIVQKYNFCKSNEYGTDLKLKYKTAFGLNVHSSFVGSSHNGFGLESMAIWLKINDLHRMFFSDILIRK